MTSESLERQAMAIMSSALEQASPEREEWVRNSCGGNSLLFDRVMSLLTADKDHGSVMRTGGAGIESSMPPPPKRIGAYEIIGLIGQGGMGAVYEGKRVTDNFDLRVAIKIVRPGALSNILAERFERERQVLAALNHPNIARLFDGGQLENGAPYIVMEYIDGQPITEWAARQKFTLKDKLALFCDLCRAVQHAHQNLIIHRDITPSNVLVNKQGEIKLIDFGIAKPHSIDAATDAPEASSIGGLSFTPGFAAPERSKGAAANTLSDVYSLGKILEALTELHASNKDLRAIVSKASAKEPSTRYASVDTLLEDIQNLSSGRKVEARSGGLFYQVGKFVNRHRYANAAAGIFITGLISALFIVLGLYQQAERAEATAQKRFAETRQLTNFLIDGVSDELINIPGTLPARRKIIETSSQYLDILAEAAQTDESVRLEYAMGLAEIAEVTTQAGGANLGDPQVGRANYEKSLELLRELDAEPNASSEIKLALADVQYAYGYAITYHFGEVSNGANYVRAALTNYDTVTEKDPSNAQAAIDRQVAKQMLSYLDPDLDIPLGQRLDELEEGWRDINTRFPDHHRRKPQFTSFLRIAANYALDEWEDKFTIRLPSSTRVEYDKAVKRVQRSVELANEMIKEEPTNTEHIYQYIWSLEIEAILLAMDLEWQIEFETMLADLAPIARAQGLEGVERTILTNPALTKLRAAGDELFSKLDHSDALLERLAPFDGGTFTHVEAVYYNLKARAYVAAKLRIDLEQSEAYLNEALAMTEAFLANDPDFRNAKLEKYAALIELAYLYSAKSVLDGVNRTDQACTNLRASEEIMRLLKLGGDELEDYKDYEMWNEQLIRDLGCI